MNWTVILNLSMLGLIMGVATTFIIPSHVEPWFWLAIFLMSAYVIAKVGTGRPLRHGVLVGLMNAVWVTACHMQFFRAYVASHPAEAAMMKSMPFPGSPRLMMALVGPVIGLLSGLAMGALAVLVSKFVKSDGSVT